jgi:hypothetical protein
MAAPEFVPVPPLTPVRAYESPPRRPDPWMPDRPGDLETGQPRGERYGVQGPDQGYALKIASEVFVPQLQRGRVSVDDAVAGCLGVALKRAALFGRAPVAHDWRVAFTVWGFFDPLPPQDLVDLRQDWFAEVAHPYHYAEARRIVDAVPDETLRMTPQQVAAADPADWRSLLSLSASAGS